MPGRPRCAAGPLAALCLIVSAFTEPARALAVGPTETSEAAADRLDAMVAARIAAGDVGSDTLSLASRAVLARQEALGDDHPSLAEPLLSLGYLLHVASDLPAAQEVYRWSLRVSAEGTLEAARSAAGLGGVEADLGDREAADRLLRQSARIVEALFGPAHPRTASSLFSLAFFLFEHQEYDEARLLWLRALEIFESQDPRTPEAEKGIGRSLNNLGELHHRLGEMNEAREYLERALAIRERGSAAGGPHPQAASSAAALARLSQDNGAFEAARDYYHKALEGFESWPEPHRRSEALSGLGLLLEETGDYEGALRRQEEALALRLADPHAAEDPWVGRLRSRLGRLLVRTGDLERAQDQLERALRLQLATLGPKHADVAATLVARARVEVERGESAAARRLLENAVEILAAVSRSHPDLIEPLTLLAQLEAQGGMPDEASLRIEEGLEAVRRLYGADGPRSVGLLYERARLGVLSGDLQAALGDALKAAELEREQIRGMVLSVPEKQALRFVESRRGALDLLLGIAERLQQRTESGETDRAWDALVRSRALVLQALGARVRLVAALDDPGLAALAAAVASSRERLAALYVHAESRVLPERRPTLVQRTLAEVDDAERALAEASAAFLEARREQAVGLVEIRRSLPPETGLVAFARYQDPLALSGEKGAGDRYLAFVVGRAESPTRLIPLGAAEAIDEALEAWRALFSRGLDGSREAERQTRRAGRRLRALLWDPVARELEGVERVLVVPDGMIHLVNLAALPAAGGRYLIEEGKSLHLLMTERDLVQLRRPSPRGQGMLAVGGVDFERRARHRGAFDAPAPGPARTAFEARGWSRCERFSTRRFMPLPGTAREVRDIAELWARSSQAVEGGDPAAAAIRVLTGGEAGEAEFKQLAPGRRIVHLATHGFFLGGECAGAREDAATGSRAGDVMALRRQLPALTGLALSGANQRDSADAVGADDGMLTALEVSTLDLRGAEWVVLSACNSGVGDIRAGEGTFGLRRAFAEAGARTVVMSLDQVDDESTYAFMSKLYTMRLERGLGTLESVRSASLELLRERRRSSLSTHPIFWASFVASGDWR